jgi:hypothetical protein
MPAGLSIERAPPQAVPLRFLLTAPWFATIAACVLLWGGPDAIASRWTGVVLAATHLITLGFMAHAMLGALLQLLPVVAGVPIPRSSLVAAVAHPALLLGTLTLAAAFLSGVPVLFPAAMTLLAIAFGLYLAALALGFVRQRLHEASAHVILVAVLSLLVTIALGLVLAAGLSGLPLPLLALTQLHTAWGILGWTLLLVLGAALAIVPMFQMTQSYPGWLRGGFAAAMFAALAVWSVAVWFEWDLAARVLQWLLAAGVATIAVTTLTLQQRGRRRRQPDVTFLYWRLGMLCLLAAVAVWVLAQATGRQGSQQAALLLGVLLLPGFAVSVVAGMLYKIVPFLLWLTLQLRVGGRPPQVREILPDASGHPQLWVHMVSVVLLAAAVTLWSGFIYPAAGALAVSSALLGVNLSRATLFARSYVARTQPLPRGAGRSRWKSIS